MFFKIFSLFNFIYKKNCCICGKKDSKDFLCISCLKTLDYLPGYPQNVISGVNVYSCFLYEGNVKELIHNYKFKNKVDLVNHFAYFLSVYFNKFINNKNVVVTYVPSHKKRISKRGFDHSFLLAKTFSFLNNLDFQKDLLLKIKYTKPQYLLSNKERKENVKGSFSFNKKCNINKEKIVLLIDDIITTGSTLSECIKVLKEEGFNNIICLTLCKK